MFETTFSFSRILAASMAIGVLTVSSCKEKDPVGPTPGYQVPATYNFNNVNYTGQTQRLAMLTELTTYGKTANTGAVLDITKLKNMYSNSSNPFNDAALNSSGKQLKDKTFSLDRTYVEALLDSLAEASKSTSPGSNGVTGIVTSNDGTKKYLCNGNGVDYPELLEKVMMGALIYYQISSVYLSEDKLGATIDNTTVTPGQGTSMEHHWDEAFGYFGVPKDFPANVAGLLYVGKYTNARNSLMQSNKTIMDAYLKGRAAISNKDMPAKDAQVTIIRNELERVFAATAISYINKAKATLSDNALRNHALTEALGFAMGLKYAANRKINDSQLASVIATLSKNYYTITVSELDAVKAELSAIYGLNNIKDTL